MIYEIYKKQVEAWKERFDREFMEYAEENENTLIDPDTDGNQIKSFISSSRHKDTIELIEAEIERKKQMREEVKERFDVGDAVRWINQGGNLTSNQADSIKYLGHYQAIDEDIAYLESQLTLLKNER